MSVLRSLVQRVRVLWRLRAVEDELAEELRDHVEREVARQRALGVPEPEARRQALLRTGAIESLKEQVRDERGGRLVHDFLGDLRLGARTLRRSPGFAAAVILSLAIGVAAVTAIASVVGAVLIRPLPYPESDRLHLVRVWWNEFGASLSAADYLRLREASGPVAEAAAYVVGAQGYTLLGQGEPHLVFGAELTPETARVLRVPPVIGRWFTEGDRGTEALISEALWRSRFGGSTDALGRRLVLDEGTYTVVGVMPTGFNVPGQDDGEVWLSSPIGEPRRRGPFFLSVALRLKPGVTPEQATARLTTAVAPVLAARYRAEPTWRYLTTPMKDVVVGDTGATLWLFLAGTVLVLLIATANAANLLLARGAARTRELAVRASLGARRERLVRQLLAESAVLGLCSAVAGLAGAWGLTRLLVAQAGPLIPRAGEVRMDLATGAVAMTVAVGAAMLAGVAPALWLTGRRLGESTRTGGRTATGGRAEGRVRRAMVVAEVALALCVLVGTALLAKTMARLQSQPPGFDAAGVLSFRLVAPPEPYRDRGKLAAYLESVDANLRRLPGVSHVAVAASLPPDRGQESNNYTVEGDEPGRAGRGTEGSGVAIWNVVSPEFFDALAIPAIRGRTFTVADGANAPAVAVVSRLFAQKHFPGGDAIGRRFKGGDWSAAAPWTTIVGVVDDVPYQRGVWGGPSPTVYLPHAQNAGSRWLFVVVRTASEAATAPGLASAVQSADPRVPLRDTATMTERLVKSTAVPRFRVRLFGSLAGIALTLAIIGIHGILAYQVGQRRKETAIRQALGARRPAILAGVVRSGLGLTAAGIGVGLAVAFTLARMLATFLFGVTPDDVSAYVWAAAALLSAAALASVLPALKAIGADPLSVLRED